MSDIETRFRLAYDALLEEMPDPPSFDDITTHTVIPTRLSSLPVWIVAVASAAVVLLLIGGAAALFSGAEAPLEPVGVVITIEETPERDESTPLFSEVEIARGFYAGTDTTWIMSAFQSTDGLLCIRLDGMSCVSRPEGTGEHLVPLATYDGVAGRFCGFGAVVGAERVELELSSGVIVEAPIYTHPSFETDFYAYCGLGDQRPVTARVFSKDGTVIGPSTVPLPAEILSDRVVTDDEFEMAGSAVVQCLADVGVEASFNMGDGSFTTQDSDESTFNRCYQQYMGDSVQKVWSDQNYDPEEDFRFYSEVVACTEAETGDDYGEMTQDTLGFMSTDARRTIDRALAEAPDVYDRCFDNALP